MALQHCGAECGHVCGRRRFHSRGKRRLGLAVATTYAVRLTELASCLGVAPNYAVKWTAATCRANLTPTVAAATYLKR